MSEWSAKIEKMLFRNGYVETQHSVEAEQYIARFFPISVDKLNKLAIEFYRKCWDKKFEFGLMINKESKGGHPPYVLVSCPYQDCEVCDYVRRLREE